MRAPGAAGPVYALAGAEKLLDTGINHLDRVGECQGLVDEHVQTVGQEAIICKTEAELREFRVCGIQCEHESRPFCGI
jgi:hypothetical protein